MDNTTIDERSVSMCKVVGHCFRRLGNSLVKLSSFKVLVALGNAPDCWFTLRQVSSLSSGEVSRIPICVFEELNAQRRIKIQMNEGIDYTSPRYLFKITEEGLKTLDKILFEDGNEK